MATLSRPFLMTGAALVSAAAIAAVPSVTSTSGLVAGVPTPAKLSTAQYELTALSDISLQGINDAIANGWGGNLGPADSFYPGVYNNDVKVTGVLGAAYYVLDQAAIVPFNLEDYYFEAGGLKAVAYVGITSVFGANSLPGTLAKAVFVDGTMDIQDAVVALTSGIPVVGDLTSVYFTGQAAGDTTVYGTGFDGVTAYVAAKYPAIAGLLSSINLGGNSKSDDESDDSNDTEDSEDSEDSEDQDNERHGNHSAAVVLTSARAAAAVPRATAVASASVVRSAAAVTSQPSDSPAEVAAPEADAATDSVADVPAAAPKRTTARGSQADSPKRAAHASARAARG